MPLSDATIRSAKPAEKAYKLPDEKGLFLLVHTNGSKYWRHKYRFAGKEKLLAHGTYPEVSLKEAREKRDAARRLLAQGIDPSENKKAQKAARLNNAANSFEVIAREWFAKTSPTLTTNHAGRVLSRLEKDIFPILGKRPVAEITAPEVLAMLRRIEARGALETAFRAKVSVSQIFRYAIATGRTNRDPCPDLKGALQPAKKTHFASITHPEGVGELLRAMDAFSGTLVVKSALLLAPLVFVRPAELRTAKWADIDFEKAEWRYFVTKTKTEHLVPLANQAITLLKNLYPLTGDGIYLFPSARTAERPMSDAAINAALRRLGYDTKEEMTGHGFRAMARTLLHEELGQKPEVIEHQLAHRVPDVLGAAYNRTKFLKERKIMMQLWADYLEQLKNQTGRQ